MSDEIIPSLSLETLLVRRDAALTCLETIRQAVVDFVALGEAIGFNGSSGRAAGYKFMEPLKTHRHMPENLTSEDWLPWARSSLDAAVWEHLLDKSGLRTFLDAKARDEWDKQIEENKTIELTPANIAATFRNLHDQRGDFFERGVVAIFRRLSWDYKSNMPQKFGKRLVVHHVVDFRFGTARPETGTCSELDDLVRAFCVLEGKPEPDHRQGVYSHLDKPEVRQAQRWSNEYLEVRTFKNGNGHVYLLKPDLVDKLNLILAKHYPNALPSEAP
jgi:Domain of unknown function (DUF4942)